MKIDDIGDYRKHQIVTFDTKDKVMNTAILIHEFVEAMIIYAKGLTSKDVDLLDKHPRRRGHKTYLEAHKLALKVEKKFVEACGRDWKKHNKDVYKIEIKK